MLRSDLMISAAEFLQSAQNEDGGWGYRVRGMSYVEPTAAVLLVLRAMNVDASRIRARDFLLMLQHADGGWGIGAIDPESGWMTSWAVLALADFPEARAAAMRGVEWLVANSGLRVTDAPARAKIHSLFQIDSTLRGWSWQIGDASWVHPTSLAILALAAMSKRDDSRVREGVQYLYDRAVETGGWNIGNPTMIDKKIPATIQDTAIALLALRAAGELRGDEQIARAIRFLQDSLTRAKTLADLAWGVYALKSWGIDVKDAIAQLQFLANAVSANPFNTAIAMLALAA